MPEDTTHTHTEDPSPNPDSRPKADEDSGSSSDVKTPFSPHEDDDSAFGDTDQHSTA